MRKMFSKFFKITRKSILKIFDYIYGSIWFYITGWILKDNIIFYFINGIFLILYTLKLENKKIKSNYVKKNYSSLH